MSVSCTFSFFFFFNDTATTEIYTLSLHDALPISFCTRSRDARSSPGNTADARTRSEEHTSELQSQFHLVCRLLLEKKKKNPIPAPGQRKNHATTAPSKSTNLT